MYQHSRQIGTIVLVLGQEGIRSLMCAVARTIKLSLIHCGPGKLAPTCFSKHSIQKIYATTVKEESLTETIFNELVHFSKL